MNLESRFIELRKKNGYSQSDIAEKLNITPSAYGFYEQGRSVPNAKILNQLATLYEVTTDYLLGRSNTPQLDRKEERDIQKDLAAWKADLENGTLQMKLDGDEIDEEVKQFIVDNMENTLILARLKAKEKFTPNKYKK